MKETSVDFRGFSTDAAKKSCIINKALKQLIASVERDIKIVTSTPKLKKMEISSTNHSNFYITVDHDSGYMSHNQESNSDSSVENLGETVPNSSSRPIFLSEDALLEKPEVCVKSKYVNRSSDVGETKKNPLQNSAEECPDMSMSSDTILSTSVVSQRTTYSGFDDSDSNLSIEVPYSKLIVVENEDSYNSSINNLNNADSFFQERFAQNKYGVSSKECINKSMSFHSTHKFERLENSATLTNITNMDTKNKDRKRRLTLIFSKNDKENMYSVKRKYQSISPDKNSSLEKSDVNLDDILIDQTNKENRLTSEDILHRSANEDYNTSISNNYKENSLSTTENEIISPEKSLYPEKSDMGLNCSSTNEVINKSNVINELKNINVSTDSECAKKNIIFNEKYMMDNGDTKKSIQNKIIQTSFVENDSPQKDLILKKELDIDEIVFHQENISSLDRFDKKNEETAQCDSNLENPVLITTPRKKSENTIDPNFSPDLFDNDEIVEQPTNVSETLSYISEEKFIVKKDYRILRRAQNSLKGVLPPRSITVVYLSIDEMLNRLETNKEYFWINEDTASRVSAGTSSDTLNTSGESNPPGESKSLLVSGRQDCVNVKWPEILLERYHGLHHNRSKLSEEFEELCAKFGQRYVGAETQSSCTVFSTNFPSPTKRKQIKPRWAVKSPGRRLSHLAKRKITFSSANLQGGASSIIGSRARQILVDARKLELLNLRKSPRKSPRKHLRRTPRKTPSKSPRLKTRSPTNSAKKKLAQRFRQLTGEIENTSASSSKRALFLSPDRDSKASLFQPSTSGLSTFKNELLNSSAKRAVFLSPSKSSPLKNSPFKASQFKRLELGVDIKRKRLDYDDAPSAKLARRSPSIDIHPSETELMSKFSRARSEMIISANKQQTGVASELSTSHKKKLQWAVYEALRSQNITHSHAQFKVFASVLARVTRRLLPNLMTNGPKECGTTEKMLRIARIHVYAVIKGKSVDEIINEYLRSKAKTIKPQGYVGPADFNNERSSSVVQNKERVAQVRCNTQDKKRLELLDNTKGETKNRVDRIRKVINFGDDNR